MNKTVVLLTLNTVLLMVMIGLVANLELRVNSLKAPVVITKTVTAQPKSFACTGVLNENLTGTTVPSQAVKSDSQAIEVLISGSTIKLSGVVPVTINCTQ